MKTISVLLVEDHHLVREALRALLEEDERFRVVGQAEDGLEAARLAEQLHPDIVVMDVVMPHLNGLEAAARMREMNPPPHVIILSQYDSPAYVAEALLAGAGAYLLKDAAVVELTDAASAVLAGERYLSADLNAEEIEAYLHHRQGTLSPLDRLTGREREVLQMVAEGLTNRQVALRLSISVKTVEKHRFSLMEKLSIRDVTGLVRFALAHGVIKGEEMVNDPEGPRGGGDWAKK